MRRISSFMFGVLGIGSVAHAGEYHTVGAGGEFADLSSALAALPSDEMAMLQLLEGDHGTISLSDPRPVSIRAEKGDDVRIAAVKVSDAGAHLELNGITIAADGSAGPAVSAIAGSVRLVDVNLRSAGVADTPAVRVNAEGRLEATRVTISGFRTQDGAVHVDSGQATLELVGIYDSESTEGAGIWARNAKVDLHGVYIARANAANRGGAIFIDGGTFTADILEIEDVAAPDGGAIFVNAGTARFTDLESREAAAGRGGHLYVAGGEVELVRSELNLGRAEQGGGIFQSGGQISGSNALWTHLTAQGEGAATWITGGSLELQFATLFDMRSGAGAAVGVSGGAADVSHSILARVSGAALEAGPEARLTWANGLLWNVDAPVWNVGASLDGPEQGLADPQFVDGARGNLTLRTTSPALDAGVSGWSDVDGSRADLGAWGGPSAWALDDVDGDGFVRGRDCDDTDPSIHEGASDAPYDGIDRNCDFLTDYDGDGDGFEAAAFGGPDCDDTDASVKPNAAEQLNDGLDLDCDGLFDPDLDGDGWESTLDCNDLDGDIRPDADEIWYDGVDQDCSGGGDADKDGDGFDAQSAGGSDCNDEDAKINPLVLDSVGDGLDQNCDGVDASASEEAGVKTEAVEATEVPDADRVALNETEGASSMATTGCSTAPGRMASLGALLVGLLGMALRRR